MGQRAAGKDETGPEMAEQSCCWTPDEPAWFLPEARQLQADLTNVIMASFRRARDEYSESHPGQIMCLTTHMLLRNVGELTALAKVHKLRGEEPMTWSFQRWREDEARPAAHDLYGRLLGIIAAFLLER